MPYIGETMNKICVYTCITGDYDNLNEIKNIEKGIDYICYTNNKKIKSKTWRVKYITDDSLSNIKLARKIKIIGTDELKKYDVVVWIDGSIEFTTSIKKFIDKYVDLSKNDLVGFKHYCRTSIRDEIIACLLCNKENAENAVKLNKFYSKENFIDECGLIESTVLFRDFKNKNVQKCMNSWFSMIINYSHRDQLSFQYAAEKSKLKYKLLDISIWNNEYFISKPHTENAIVKKRILYYDENGLLKIQTNEEKITNQTVNFKIIKCFNKMHIFLQMECDKNIIIDFPEIKECYDINFIDCIQIKNKIYCGNKVTIDILLKQNINELNINLNVQFEKNIDKLLNEVNNEFSNSRNIIDYDEYLIQKGKDEFNILENKYKELDEKYVKIANSRRWRVLEKIRHTFKKH